MFLFLSLVLCLVHISQAYYSAKVWQSLKEYPSIDDFPEKDILSSRPNTAIGFTGGGSRAYTASVGYLAGLAKLDLLKNIRYVGGISGGAWATTVFTYAQNIPDDVLLGEIKNPEDITQDNLKVMDPKCARGFASAELTLIGAEAYFSGKVDSVAGAWCYGVSKTYLEPAGIMPNQYFSYSSNMVSDILKRNSRSGLTTKDFLLPANTERPFSIIGTTLVGPNEGAPYTMEKQNYTLLEITPMYVGQIKRQDVEHKYNLLTHTQTVSGLVENYAFAVSGDAPLIGMASDHTSATLNVPEPKKRLDLQFAAGASSYAPGALVESLKPKNISEMGLHFDYWSPSNVVPSAADTLFADGGSYENIPLISFLQRRVQKIILFFVAERSLYPADKYNPYTDIYDGTQITDTVTAFFGILEPTLPNWENRSYEYEMNQVFAKEDYPKVITALQESQARGKGIFATFNLTTIENKWWGIPAGITAEVTFAYLGRLQGWEAKLSPDMYPLLVPAENAQDLSNDVSSGPYKNFPHYATMGGGISYDKANVLADLTGWSVLENADMFRSILS